MRNLLLLLSNVAVALVACRESPKTKRDPASILPFSSDSDFADRYFVEDASCQTREGAARIGRPPVFAWQRNGVQTVQFPNERGSSVESLKVTGIKGSFYNFHQRTDCRELGGRVECSDDVGLVKEPENLKVCESDRAFARTSVEGVGLSALASLSIARDFYDKISGRSASLPEARLIVLPTIETVVSVESDGRLEQEKEIMTDNLAYAPAFGNEPAFVVFPKGKASQERGLWTNINLWEMGWGMAHEFGHHVFRWHALIDDAEQQSFLPIHSFDFSRDKHAVEIQRTQAGQSAKNIIGATNEAFADLFAYYTYGAAPGLANGIDCFAKSRDVDSPEFFNGERKQLTARVLAQFRGELPAGAGSCTKPSYDDIHIIGAIVAHGVARLMASKDDPDNNAARLLAWAEAIGARTQNNNISLRDFISDALRLVATGGTRLTAAQCQIVREVFPAYAGQWLGANRPFQCG